MLINSIFRKNLKLRHHGAIFTTIALTATPGFIASMNHNYLITNPILLYENNCSTCLYSTASVSVNLCGVLFPLITSPTINLAIASTLGYRVPYIYEVREICKFWWSAVKPKSNFLLLSLVANAIMINIIVYKQMQSMDRVTDIILKIEQAINDGLISLETITQ
ncbi:PREDICTED: uncharacterized protein LOC108573537 [Habropoda laboriosa]|nr:PREDICTED: uncharacterized protein LOC108573537 [Habropoda laboriosa]